MSRNMLMAMQAALMMSSVVGMLDDDLRGGCGYRHRQKPQEKKMSLYERELHRVEIERRRKARLKAFVIKGKTIMANSWKDAIKRYNHRHLED